MADKDKKVVILCGGEVGGIGKSTLTKLILEFISDRTDYEFYDLDSNKLDVGLVYEPDTYKVAVGEDNVAVAPNPKTLIRFSDDDNIGGTVDEVFEQGLNKLVIVNLPSNCKHHLERWINDNGLVDLAKENNIQFIYFFVCAANPDSVELFARSLEEYGNDKGLQQVLVFNEGKGVSYDRAIVGYPKLKQLAEAYKTPVLIVPKLNSLYYNEVLTKSLTFHEAKTKTDKDGLKMIGRSSVNKFLNVFNDRFTETLKALGGKVQKLAEKPGGKG